MKDKIFILLLTFSSFFISAQDQLSQTKSEKLFQKGYELVTHANYGAARQVFTEYLETAPLTDARRGEAEYYVAFSALNLNHIDGEKLIDNFVTSYPASSKAATAYFDLGNFFYEEKNYTKASTYYKKAEFPSLTVEQQNEGHFKWGYSYFNLKKLNEALEQFNFIKNTSSGYAPAANYYSGFIEYSTGDYATALVDLKRAESSPAYAGVVPYLIANIYYKQRRYDDVIQYAASVKGRKDLVNADEFAMLLADAYYYKSDFQNAAAQYDQYLGDNPAKATSPLLFRAGFANYSLKRNKKALDYLSKSAAGKDSVSYYASYYLGILYLQEGEKPLAQNSFNIARRHAKDPALADEATFQYAKVSYDAGRAEQAITELEKYLADFPQSSHKNEAKELLAQAYVNGNNYHKAIEYIESLPSRNPQIEEAYQKATYLKGVEHFNKDEYELAVQNFEKSVRYPRDQKYLLLAHYWAGESYSAGRRYEDALRSYEKVLAMSSGIEPESFIKSRYGAGYAHYNLQAYDKALTSFREFTNRASKTDPNYADALVRLADCYYVSKQYPLAIETYNRAKTSGSLDQDYILLQTGVVYGIQRNYTASRDQLSTLVRSYPNSPYRDEAMFQRGQFDIEMGNYQAAVEGLSQLIRESPGSRFLPYAHMRRAASNYNLKQYAATIDDYARVISQFPTHPVAEEALLPLQEALNIAGRSGEFEKYLTDFKSVNPDNKNLEQIEFDTGKNLFFDQQYQPALTKLLAFTASYPESSRLSEARYYIAESHYRLKSFDKSLPVYLELANDNTFSMANRVEGRIAEILFNQGKFENAIIHFHKLARLATSKKEQYTAWSGLMESFYNIGSYDSSAAYAQTIIKGGAVNASAHNKASLYLGKNAMAKGDYETAQDEFLNTVNAAQDEFGAEAKYLIADILYKQKQYKQSYETLVSLTNDFSSYDEWVGNGFLLMADNFVAMENIEQAKATLESLAEFPLEKIQQSARTRLAEIEKAAVQKIQSDTTNTGDN